MSLVFPFVLQVSLGGFENSSAVCLWGFTAPLGARLFVGTRQAVPWFVAFVGLVLVSGGIDPALATGAPHLLSGVVFAAFVLNVLGVATTAYVLLQYFVRARIAGAKGATGDQGSAPQPSYSVVGTLGNVFVAANDESTGTISCPAGMRVLSGSPSGVTTGPGPPRLTVVTSEPNQAGTGWIVTMRAGAQEQDFQVEAVCAFVD
jgi:hypothetical protein